MTQIAFAFVAGVSLLQQSNALPSTLWLLPLVISGGIALHNKKWRLLGWFILGCAWALVFSYSVLSDRLDRSVEGKNLVIEGSVIGLPQHFDRGVRFGFDIDFVEGVAKSKVVKKVRLSWYSAQAKVHVGDRWRFVVRLKRPHGNFNSANFDYEKWLFVNRYRATGYVKESDKTRLLSRKARWYWPNAWREAIDERISAALGKTPARGIIKALTIGSRDEISADQWRILRITGTAHLIAISGLHIGLIAGFGYFACKWIWCSFGSLRIAPRIVAELASIIVSIIYASLAGFSLPTQRALIMVMIVMGGILCQRHVMPVRSIAVAVFLIVVLDPLAVLSAGFWLSFAAVSAIAYVTVGRMGHNTGWIGANRIAVVTAVGLAPLLMLFFQQVSLIAPIANIIAVPWVSLLVVPLCLVAAGLLSWFPALGNALLGVAEFSLQLIWTFLEWLSVIPYASWSLPEPPMWVVLLAIMGVAILFLPKGLPGRWLGVIVFLPLCFPSLREPNSGTAVVTLLDVGQGLASVVQTQNHTLVFDTGARFSADFDMGSAVVTPFLRSQGINRIDRLIISHGDNDHSGGAHALAREFEISSVYSSVPTQIPWVSARLCEAGQSWTWDGVAFQILSPLEILLDNDNENSCVLQIVSMRGDSVLMTGDIEKKAESMLVGTYGEKMHSTYLIIPHHGSNTSSTKAFLDAVDPVFGLVSAGYRNRYGFPRPAVLKRLERAGIKVMNTAESGAIQVGIGTGPSIPLSYRESNGKFYNFASDSSG